MDFGVPYFQLREIDSPPKIVDGLIPKCAFSSMGSEWRAADRTWLAKAKFLVSEEITKQMVYHNLTIFGHFDGILVDSLSGFRSNLKTYQKKLA